MKGVKNMKKQYVKPELYFENFQLSTSIAACGTPTQTPSNGDCGITVTGYGVLFLTSVSGCEKKVADGYEGICYHQPTDTTNLFNS